MRHPHLKVLWHTVEENGITTFHSVDDGLSVLMLEARGNLTAKDVSELLHTVADPQDRNIALLDHLPDFGADMRSAFVVDTGGTTTQNDSHQLMLSQVFRLDQTGVQLTVDVQFTDPTSNQVRVLRTKVQDCNLRSVGR